MSFTPLGLPAVQPRAAWAALCLCPDGSLLVASYRTSDTAGSQVWRITNPRGHATVTLVAGAPAVVEDIAVVDGVVYAACGTYGLYRVDPARRVDGARAGHVPRLPPLVGRRPQRRPLGRQRHRHDRPPLHRPLARRRPELRLDDDRGPRLERGARRRPQLVARLGVAHLAEHAYSVSQLAVDPANANICYSAGRSGVVVTRDGGATWQPAMNGLDGSEINQVQAGPAPERPGRPTRTGSASTPSTTGARVRASPTPPICRRCTRRRSCGRVRRPLRGRALEPAADARERLRRRQHVLPLGLHHADRSRRLERRSHLRRPQGRRRAGRPPRGSPSGAATRRFSVKAVAASCASAVPASMP